MEVKAADTVVTGPTRARSADYVTLAKPRLNMLVVASAMVGFVMGGGPLWNVRLVLMTLIGTALVAGGASAFNQVIERFRDARMERTRLRPMADRRLQPFEGFLFGAVMSAAGYSTSQYKFIVQGYASPVPVGANIRYRFHKNWAVEASYIRRVEESDRPFDTNASDEDVGSRRNVFVIGVSFAF